MREDLRNKLLRDYPDLFPREDPLFRKGSGIPMQIDCGDGWYHLIYKLCEDLRKILKQYPGLKEDFQVAQVKEKFGGLRFYIGYGNDEIFDRIRKAEEDSYKTCEFCGRLGKLRQDLAWWRTLCDECYQEELERQNDMYSKLKE